MTNIEKTNAIGALVYWSLHGSVDLQDLQECLAAEDFEENWHPGSPSLTDVVQRAALACVSGRRQYIRPLGTQGSYVLVTETVLSEDESGGERVQVENSVALRVLKDGDGHKRMTVTALTDEREELAQKIREKADALRYTMTAQDISGWLLHTLKSLHAVSLRDRGGFYFIPTGPDLDKWTTITNVLGTVSDHKTFQIPAMRAEETIIAISHGVRAEAEAVLEEFEAYLAGDVSTRGLNSWEGKASDLQSKLGHYAKILGSTMEDLDKRAEILLGALQSARLVEGAAE